MGLGSKLSMWLTPPFMKSQITLLARGRTCGRPSGGNPPGADARRTPSRAKVAPVASPVKPIPRSARNVRRVVGRILILCGPDPMVLNAA